MHIAYSWHNFSNLSLPHVSAIEFYKAVPCSLELVLKKKLHETISWENLNMPILDYVPGIGLI